MSPVVDHEQLIRLLAFALDRRPQNWYRRPGADIWREIRDIAAASSGVEV